MPPCPLGAYRTPWNARRLGQTGRYDSHAASLRADLPIPPLGRAQAGAVQPGAAGGRGAGGRSLDLERSGGPRERRRGGTAEGNDPREPAQGSQRGDARGVEGAVRKVPPAAEVSRREGGALGAGASLGRAQGPSAQRRAREDGVVARAGKRTPVEDLSRHLRGHHAGAAAGGQRGGGGGRRPRLLPSGGRERGVYPGGHDPRPGGWGSGVRVPAELGRDVPTVRLEPHRREDGQAAASFTSTRR